MNLKYNLLTTVKYDKYLFRNYYFEIDEEQNNKV